jgi:hypothetical protein
MAWYHFWMATVRQQQQVVPVSCWPPVHSQPLHHIFSPLASLHAPTSWVHIFLNELIFVVYAAIDSTGHHKVVILRALLLSPTVASCALSLPLPCASCRCCHFKCLVGVTLCAPCILMSSLSSPRVPRCGHLTRFITTALCVYVANPFTQHPLDINTRIRHKHSHGLHMGTYSQAHLRTRRCKYSIFAL